MKTDHKKEAQEQYVALQMLDMQMKQVQKQMMAIEEQTEELTKASVSLNELSACTEGTKAFVPLAAGIYAETKLGTTQSVLVSTGAGTMVRRTLTEASGMIDEQVGESRRLQQQMADAMQKLASEAEQTKEKLQALMKDNE